MVDKRCAMMTDVRPCTMRRNAERMRVSVSVSTLDVASSKIKMRGLAARARAKLMSCFCPVERVLPRSRTGSANPPGSARMKSPTLTSSDACSICASLIESAPRRMLLAIVPVNRNGSCRTTAKRLRSAFKSYSRTSTPSIRMLPCCTS